MDTEALEISVESLEDGSSRLIAVGPEEAVAFCFMLLVGSLQGAGLEVSDQDPNSLDVQP